MHYEVSDRRPIAARKLSIVQQAGSFLARRGVSANAISVVGMLLATLAAGALVLTRFVDDPVGTRLLWAVAILGVQGRLICNLLDGLVAVERKTASKLGEIFNEVPDRYSDAVVLIALGYAAGGFEIAGWAAALAAILTAYIRALGKSLGQPSDFRGPMAKQQRMFLVMLVALTGIILPSVVERLNLAGWVAWVIAVGAMLTTMRRLNGIVGRLK